MVNSGFNKLARVMAARMRKTNMNVDQLEFGKILEDLSLRTDHFPIPIPKGEYFVTKKLTENTANQLKKDDRVLVAWVNQGTDAVITDIVLRS